MAAAGDSIHPLSRNTLHTTAQLLPGKAYPVTIWKPRSGFSEVYIKWKLDSHNLAKALEIKPDALYTETGPPQSANSETATRSNSKNASEMEAVLQEQQRSSLGWLAYAACAASIADNSPS